MDDTTVAETATAVSSEPVQLDSEAVARHRKENLALAQKLADESVENSKGLRFDDQERTDPRFEYLRSFVEPQNAVEALEKGRGERPPVTFPIRGICQPQEVAGTVVSEISSETSRHSNAREDGGPRGKSKREAAKRWFGSDSRSESNGGVLVLRRLETEGRPSGYMTARQCRRRLSEHLHHFLSGIYFANCILDYR